jgi:hypothetical protein
VTPLNEYLIDQIMVVASFLFNVIILFIFILRAYERPDQERMLGFVFSVLFFPFTYVWVTNLVRGRDLGRLITGFPVLVFMIYDFWYREVAKRKPRHHPDRWPLGLYLYLLLYLIGGMILNGYAFFVSMNYGYLILVSYYCSLGAYGLYQYKHNKSKKLASASKSILK